MAAVRSAFGLAARWRGAVALPGCLLAFASWAQASVPEAAAYRAAGDAAAWRPVECIAALGFAFALAVGWLSRARGWALALAVPAALLPPAWAAWTWSGPASVWIALACSVAGGALGQALRPRRWLRSVAGASAVGLALAALVAALFRQGVPKPGDIGVAAISLLLATPLLVGVIAPPMAAWRQSRGGCLLRALVFAALAWFAWLGLQRLTGGAAARMEISAWLGLGVLGLFVWVLVFFFDGSGSGASRARGYSGGGARDASGAGGSSRPGGSGDSGWSGGGGGASGSW
ncbi:hypothetical protein J5226_10485 [Lysobacter sp. K5869]|uniref:hypothetical protein n=1 Tax=Lysobacter sp. K5869 TaxID=2820808 RepID=UPI001C060844|nr:hypothetical protein [Lysobacter sp. K5869]QWP78784.1 hypothetical protein J5226_10485 [Lysobacter sp. K5869]